LNGGQLTQLLRARYLIDAVPFPKLQGRPFAVSEVEAKIEEVLS
jgi:2-oxoglutarate ferredoxin oxidoreductase subunit alpha